MIKFHCSVLAMLSVAGAALAADDLQVPLAYNFNGMVHSGESGIPDSLAPSGFRSIADRGLVIDGTNTGQVAFGALPIVGATGLTYSIVNNPFQLDIVMLGNRNLNAAWDLVANTNNRGVMPDWLPNDDLRVPQTTTLTSPVLLDAYSEIGLLYHISNVGSLTSTFTATLHFSDAEPLVVTITGRDWFGTRPAIALPSGSPLSHLGQMGVFKGATDGDRGTPSTDAGQRLNVWEAVIDVRKVLQAGLGDYNGKSLVAISYTYPNPVPAGNRNYAIFATTVRTGSAPAANSTCETAIPISPGVTAGTNVRAASSAPSDCGGDDDAGVWYTYTATTNNMLEARTCGSAMDTTMVVYSGCGGTEIACSDNGCGPGARVVWQGSAGTQYKIRIAGKANANGVFNLTLDDPAIESVPVVLNYNFNGIVHGPDEQGEPNFNNSNGYRSIADRGIMVQNLADNALDATPVVGGGGMVYTIVSDVGALDIVHLGDRNFVGNAIRAYGTSANNAQMPIWEGGSSDNTGPQVSDVSAANYTFTADTKLGVIYQIAENGGRFDVRLGFDDNSSVTLTLTAPDWFNSQVVPAPGVNSGLIAQRQLGVYSATEGTDLAVLSTNGLNLVEAVTSVAEMAADGLGDHAGKRLSTVTFLNPVSNANYPNSQPNNAAGFAIFASTLQNVTIGSDGCPADLGTTGGVAGQDGILNNNDFIVFIDYFFNLNPLADRGVTGGVAGSDGLFNNNDFIVFIDQFFAGCGG